jgi:hypothetical protein
VSLAIISGQADSGVFEALRAADFQLVFLPLEEYGPYEAFIRRSEALRKYARCDAHVALVDRGFLLSGAQNRMLERIARGLGATVLGAPWCGVSPDYLPRNPGPGIGNWLADVLLVCSGPAQGGQPPFWPYISSRPDGPAAWLTEQLETAGVRERDLYWANAQTIVEGVLVPEDSSALRSRPWKSVFALGEDAFLWAREAGFENVSLEHYPTWWWNYRAGKDYPAVRAIREATRVPPQEPTLDELWREGS